MGIKTAENRIHLHIESDELLIEAFEISVEEDPRSLEKKDGQSAEQKRFPVSSKGDQPKETNEEGKKGDQGAGDPKGKEGTCDEEIA